TVPVRHLNLEPGQELLDIDAADLDHGLGPSSALLVATRLGRGRAPSPGHVRRNRTLCAGNEREGSVSELHTADATLHVEVDGSGPPVTVFAHGLTNSCSEPPAFTPFAPGTSVRFCFRGHGHSSAPPPGAYAFADFARDLDAVATATHAVSGVGTSLGAGALLHLLDREPSRFERLVFLLPAALDRPIGDHSVFDRTAELLETLPREEAVEAILRESGRESAYERDPALRA